MWVLPEKQMCFLANPKTASLATAHALETLGFKHYGDQHSTPIRSGWNRWQEVDDTWTIFCTVRNHFDVFVSWYFHNTRTPGTSKYFGYPFERFLYEWAFNPKWFHNNEIYWERRPWCNKILYYETLQADFDNLLVSCGLPATQLQQYNISKNRKGRHYREFYTESSIRFIEDKFGPEMILFNYRY